MMRLAAVLVPLCIGALLLHTGIAKVVRPGDLINSLRSVGFGYWPTMSIVWAVTVFELVVGAGLLLRPGRHLIGAALAGFTLFTAYLLWILTLRETPACGCTGLIQVFNNHKANAAAGIARNLVCIGSLILIQQRREARPPSTPIRDAHP